MATQIFNSTLAYDDQERQSENDWNPNDLSDGDFLRGTLRLYGSVFVACLVVFCFVRGRYPKAYNLRSGWVEGLATSIATNSMGRVSWLWKVWKVPEKDLFYECGMDALCLSRVLQWGAKLCLFGSIVGCVLLMPVYATAHNGNTGVEQLNTSNVPDGAENGEGGRFIATVAAAYVIFGYAMYSAMWEFEWFYGFRYNFLSRPLPRNYAVYVRNLGEDYNTPQKLSEYFTRLEDDNNLAAGANNSAMAKALVTAYIPRLKTLVSRRAAVLAKLERAIDIEDVTGQKQTAVVNSSYKELKELNAEISTSIERIEKRAAIVPLGNGDDDGIPMKAAFVTFHSLKACQAAKQMMHSRDVFGMEVLEAPADDDILWGNVGKKHKTLQMGLLISIASTSALCLFWTLIMSFVATLSSVEGLKGISPKIGELLAKAPGLEPFLNQLSPLLILIFNSLLKTILEYFSKLEGPISGALLQASTFGKLSAFMIIQTFFVSAVSGSLISQLTEMAKHPEMIVQLLANSLPNQSVYFIQILLVQTCINLSLELLRVYPIGTAILRSFVGPRLTEKDRRQTFMGLRPLADPSEFDHAEVLSNIVLYFVVFFVYATLAPVTSIFIFIFFAVMGSAYRHQVRTIK